MPRAEHSQPGCPPEPEALRWTIDGLDLAGLAWGPQSGRPVLALHGWLDNALSFEALGPLLKQCRLVAVDLPGNGLSDHASADATYNLWDDLSHVHGLIDALGWRRCTLLGHSRGAIQSTLYAAAMPERVSALITLDALIPVPVSDAEAPAQLGAFLKDRVRHANRAERIFASSEDFAQRRAALGTRREAALRLAPRALEPVEDGYRLRGDPRLSGASAIKLNAAQCAAFLEAIRAPTLCLWAEQGLSARGKGAADALLAAANRIADVTHRDLPGDHHFHLDEAVAPLIAGEIEAFLAAIEETPTA